MGLFTNKTNLHDITEILLKVALNTITLALTVLLVESYKELTQPFWSH